uniref:Uncharacterized protein n=1 Tax=Onchocerca volvulus TaxID=6282 RepID=A0A8R1TN83_ONCVO
MKKFLIIFGIIILFVTLPCTSQSDESEPEPDDMNYNYDDYFDDDDDIDEGSDSEDEIIDENDDNNDLFHDSNYSTKGRFVKSDGIKKPCYTHDNCYDQREPQSWCRLNKNQSWTDKGCFCNRKLNSCIIERRNRGELEYTYCALAINWKCP